MYCVSDLYLSYLEIALPNSHNCNFIISVSNAVVAIVEIIAKLCEAYELGQCANAKIIN